jgi:hypothetical protein
MRVLRAAWWLLCRYCQPNNHMTKGRFLSPGPSSLPTEYTRDYKPDYTEH